ncbi:MAG: DUF4124 domain-containing protein [Myxococcota bacterium]
MARGSRRIGLLALAAVLAAVGAGADLFVWVDEEGRTHVTDDLEAVPEAQRLRADQSGEQLRDLWEGELLAPEHDLPPARGPEGPMDRILRGALDDLRRGETSRATVALEGVLLREPGRPEPHFYLALLDRQRGRFDAAEAHLRAFLAAAGDSFEPWRQSAQRRLRALETERQLAEEGSGPTRLVDVSTAHFRLQYDRELTRGSPDYAGRVTGYLEEARATLARLLGVVPAEPTGVVLYGKGAYLRAHRHRFSFQTVGFFDGRIHVVSAAHPAGELRALLFHEYSHALFRERSGGHKPFWLNEGLAELAEQAGLSRPALSRGERNQLRGAIQSGGWIPLADLAESFGGLQDASARLAYLESTAAADWIARRTDAGARALLLDRLGAGWDADRALRELVGQETGALDAAVQTEILAEFPEPASQ